MAWNNDVWNWIAGPNSVLHQVTQPPTFGLDDIFGGAKQGPFTSQVDEQLRNEALTGVRYMPGLSDAQRNTWIRQLQTADDPTVIDRILTDASGYSQNAQGLSQVQDWMKKQDAFQAAGEAERQGNIKSALGGIQGLEDQYSPILQGNIDRYTGILSDPNKLRSDAEFAQQLAQSEQLINNQVSQLGKQMALRNAGSGIQSSGKASNALAGARLQGTVAKSQNIGNLLSGVGRMKLGAENQKLAFDTGLTDSRNQARQTGFTNLTALQGLGQQGNLGYGGLYSGFNQGPDFTGGGLTSLDLKGLNLGQSNTNTAATLGFAGPLIGAGIQSTSAIPQAILPFVKGWS